MDNWLFSVVAQFYYSICLLLIASFVIVDRVRLHVFFTCDPVGIAAFFDRMEFTARY